MLFFSFLGQVSFGSLAREGSGSPLFVTENVTSATTHVTKVTALQQKKKNIIYTTNYSKTNRSLTIASLMILSEHSDLPVFVYRQ